MESNVRKPLKQPPLGAALHGRNDILTPIYPKEQRHVLKYILNLLSCMNAREEIPLLPYTYTNNDASHLSFVYLLSLTSLSTEK